jgi:hypothetical protein
VNPYEEIGLLAERVNQLEEVRIADENRVRSITQSVGEHGGDGREALIDSLTSVNDGIKALENQSITELKRSMRRLPGVGDWVKNTPGLGEKTVGRLIGSIGNPAYNFTAGRVRRGPAELWAYCGLHVIDGKAPRRQRGQQANWSTEAKTRAFLCAEGCVKAVGGETKSGAVKKRSPYRDVYELARLKHDGAVHKTECVRCGPSGKPAQPGSELAPGHSHARAMRAVSKEILKDLFVICKREHELLEMRFYMIDDREAVEA